MIRDAASQARNKAKKGTRNGEADNAMTAATQIDPVTVAATHSSVLATDLRHMAVQSHGAMTRPRKVRIIGPDFLPAKDTFIPLGSNR